MHIRDPIHGAILINDDEKPIIDSQFFQRLRCIKQLGFGELAFPGATHTRHAHSLGAMHIGSRVFDAVFARSSLGERQRLRLRQAVRLAMLCHDIGHLPLSHASEHMAPLRACLYLPDWIPCSPSLHGCHEEIAASILLNSSLTPALKKCLQSWELGPEAVAALVLGIDPPHSEFVVQGKDYGPVLRHIVSGELDADRMDYLLRDSFYTGVQYGRYDLDWIIENLQPVEIDSKVHLAINKAAIFAFEDFLLSRFHMFVSVYYHHTSINFDEMLRRYSREAPDELDIPAHPHKFVQCDDIWLAMTLRSSSNSWARRIVDRNGYKLVVQATELDSQYDTQAIVEAFKEAQIDHFKVESLGILSKFFSSNCGHSLYVYDHDVQMATPVAEYTPLYHRYAQAVRLTRFYCQPEQIKEARDLVSRMVKKD